MYSLALVYCTSNAGFWLRAAYTQSTCSWYIISLCSKAKVAKATKATKARVHIMMYHNNVIL